MEVGWVVSQLVLNQNFSIFHDICKFHPGLLWLQADLQLARISIHMIVHLEQI